MALLRTFVLAVCYVYSLESSIFNILLDVEGKEFSWPTPKIKRETI